MNEITTDRYDDRTAHRCAVEHARTLLGLDTDPTVRWDQRHHLQGHLDVDGVHLVLIAPRRGDRRPRLLTEREWNGLRHAVAA